MPDTQRRPKNQQERELDLSRLGRVIALVGSAHDGEALAAARTADRLLREAGIGWGDLLAPFRQLEVATEAAALLLAENISLKAELDQLRATGTAVALWQDVGATASNTRGSAQWALDLHRRGTVWLSTFEVDFLNTVTEWTGRLTQKQRPIFQQIMDRIVERTGQTPPA
jgi:hypothetical protein